MTIRRFDEEPQPETLHHIGLPMPGARNVATYPPLTSAPSSRDVEAELLVARQVKAGTLTTGKAALRQIS